MADPHPHNGDSGHLRSGMMSWLPAAWYYSTHLGQRREFRAMLGKHVPQRLIQKWPRRSGA
jgi:hypothetical protein